MGIEESKFTSTPRSAGKPCLLLGKWQRNGQYYHNKGTVSPKFSIGALPRFYPDAWVQDLSMVEMVLKWSE